MHALHVCRYATLIAIFKSIFLPFFSHSPEKYESITGIFL